MATYVRDNIIIEGARIGFRNFSGKEGPIQSCWKEKLLRIS